MKHKGGELLVLQLIKLSHLRPFGGLFAVRYVDDGVVGHNSPSLRALWHNQLHLDLPDGLGMPSVAIKVGWYS